MQLPKELILSNQVTKIFRMKDIIASPKKGAQGEQAIQDPDTKELVVFNSQTKKVTLKYCLKTLKNNEPEIEMKELIDLKTEVHKLRMEDKDNEKEYEITDEDFFTILWKF